MNVQLSNVISDITGESGLRIIEAILAGERDPEQLAALCSTRIKASRQRVAKSLHGNWDEALLFCLKTALESYRFSQNKIQDCDQCVERQLATFEIKTPAIRFKAEFANSIAPDLWSRSHQNPRH
jgi:transposase